MIRSILSSILFVSLAVLAIWFVGELIGFEIALWSTLLISIGLTILFNFLFGMFRRSPRTA